MPTSTHIVTAEASSEDRMLCNKRNGNSESTLNDQREALGITHERSDCNLLSEINREVFESCHDQRQTNGLSIGLRFST